MMKRGCGRNSRGGGKNSRVPIDGGNGFAEWGGYMAAKKQKLNAQFEGDIQREQDNSSTSSKIFNGVIIHVNGYTVPSSDELKRLMQLHGGAYQHYYGKTRVTHIIATMLPYTKLKKLTNEKVVRPEWIMESIQAGELLPCESYQLYSHRSNTQATLQLSSNERSDWSKDNRSSLANTPAKNDDESAEDGSTSENSFKTPQNEHMEHVLNEGSYKTSLSDQSEHKTKEESSKTPQNTHSKRITREDSFKTPQITRSPSTQQDNLTNPSPQGPSLNKNGKGRATAGDPNFFTEFYNNSRLHHISTWGAEFKAYVNSLHSKGDTSFPGRQQIINIMENKSDSSQDSSQTFEPPPNSYPMPSHDRSNKHRGRVIMHIDMDCFFVSVGLINRPHLRGKTVAVTHSKGKAPPTVNVEARQYEKKYYENKGKKTLNKSSIANRLKKTPGASITGVSRTDLDCTTHESSHDADCTEIDQSKVDQTLDKSLGDNHDSEPTPTPSISPATNTHHSMAEIASCSYEARQAGVKNGMFMGKAKQLCPDLEMIPYDFDAYKKVSRILYETVASYTHDIEAVSCDEMLVDITSILEDTGVPPLTFVGILRDEIKAKTQCNASAGLASSILLARMSTRVAKPNGQYYLETDEVQDFIRKQSVRDLPGVGWSMARRLQAMGMNTCDDLQKLSLGALQKEFGSKTGQSLHQYCRGTDDRPIKTQQARKSVSAEINYGIRFKEDSDAIKFVSELATELHSRLQAIGMLGKTLTLKLKVRQEGAPKETSKFLGHGVCNNLAKSVTMATATDNVDVITKESVSLLKQVKASACDMRGVGLQMSRLTSETSSHTGNKSLLDFVNRGQSSKETIPNDNASSHTTPIPSKVAKAPQTMLNFLSKPSTSDIRTSDNLSEITPVRVKRLPPLPVLPDFKTPDESGTPIARIVNNKPELTDIALAQNSGCSGFPVLPDFKTPGESGTPVGRVVQEKGQYGLPTTPSQLDQSVLSALPEDIRRQVLDSYGSEDIGQGPANRSVGTEVAHQSRTPPAGHRDWDPHVLSELPADIVAEIMQGNADGSEDNGGREVMTPSGPIEPLPNISQLDPSCLEALPQDMQDELKAAYLREQNQQQPIKTKTPPPKKTSKPASPFKINRRPRGRPPKESPSKKGYQKPANQPGIRDVLLGTTSAASPAEKIRTEQAGTSEQLVVDDHDVVTETIDPPVVNKRVNLCGAVKLQEVKNLLKEWMSTFPAPLDEDVNHIVEYLYELLIDRNLEMVTLVLKAIMRFGTRCGASAWINAYEIIEDKVQSIIHEMYGSGLKL